MHNPRTDNSMPKWLMSAAIMGQVVRGAAVFIWSVESPAAIYESPSVQLDTTNNGHGYRWRLAFDP